MFRKITGGLRRGPKRAASPAAAFAPPDPGAPLAVIGDVHGMIGPFTQLLEVLAREHPKAEVICVGDLIDRGEDSAQVLRLAFQRRDHLGLILGNHEEMLLAFLEAPARKGPRWLRYGGLQTLASFGIGGLTEGSSTEQLAKAAQALKAELGPDLLEWLHACPRFVQRGNVVVTHAGADPWHPMMMQPPQAVTWGHPDFGRRARTDGLWIVHGHTIVPDLVCANGVISVDTGAYAGGGLSCAVLADGRVAALRV
ncbi:hypothetical protein CKO11_11140 [Rhodobacter sp. TJ_12]|nr:hypothetical protein [Rhodobacter sp. TJ_12]